MIGPEFRLGLSGPVDLKPARGRAEGMRRWKDLPLLIRGVCGSGNGHGIPRG